MLSTLAWGVGAAGAGAAATALACLRVAQPHEVLVKSGFLVRGKKFGTSLVVLPRLQKYSRVNLTATVMVGTTSKIYTCEFHELNVKWVVSVQPCEDIPKLERFVNRLHSLVGRDQSIHGLVTERVGASLRSIAARNKLENINTERANFAHEIQQMLTKDLMENYGIQLTFNIDQVDSTVLQTNSQQLEAKAKALTSVEVETQQQLAARRTAELRRATAVVVAEQQRLEAEAKAALDVRKAELALKVGTEQAHAESGVQTAQIQTQTQTLRARDMAKAGADVLIPHMGLTTKGTIGAQTAMTLDDACQRVQAMHDAAMKVKPDILVLCHGGPISEPEDAQYVIKNTKGIVGFFGASSVERLPTEIAITGCVKKFKEMKI